MNAMKMRCRAGGLPWVLGLLSVMLAACGGKTAGCNDSDVKKTALSLILMQASTGNSMFQKVMDQGVVENLRLAEVTTLEHQENVDRYTCHAVLQFEMKGQTLPLKNVIEVHYGTAFLADSRDTQVTVQDVRRAANWLGYEIGSFMRENNMPIEGVR